MSFKKSCGTANKSICICSVPMIQTVSICRILLTCRRQVRIANEILMYFRSLKKMAGDLSLSDSIDTDQEGNSLSLMDIISTPDDMLDNLSARETTVHLKEYIASALTPRETKIISMRYGMGGGPPLTQREIAAGCGISRSYVSRIEKRALEKLRKCFNDAD